MQAWLGGVLGAAHQAGADMDKFGQTLDTTGGNLVGSALGAAAAAGADMQAFGQSLPPLPAPTQPAAPPTSQSDTSQAGTSPYDAALAWGKTQIGKPYIWGSAGGRTDLTGDAPGFDCSGFVAQFYNKMGLSVPAQTSSAYSATKPITADQARPGDIVEFNMDSNDPHEQHIAIYLGNGKILQSGGGIVPGVNIGDITGPGGPKGYEFRRADGFDKVSQNLGATSGLANAAGTIGSVAQNIDQTAQTIGQGKDAFVSTLGGLASAAGAQTGIDPSVYLAIAANETGWGKSKTAQDQNNLFSIQGPSSSSGGRWAGYDSPGAAFDAFNKLVSTSPRYAQAWANRADPAKFIDGLRQAGYVVDEPGFPAQGWVNNVKSIYGDLSTSDAVKAATSAPAKVGQAAQSSLNQLDSTRQSIGQSLTNSGQDFGNDIVSQMGQLGSTGRDVLAAMGLGKSDQELAAQASAAAPPTAAPAAVAPATAADRGLSSMLSDDQLNGPSALDQLGQAKDALGSAISNYGTNTLQGPGSLSNPDNQALRQALAAKGLPSTPDDVVGPIDPTSPLGRLQAGESLNPLETAQATLQGVQRSEAFRRGVVSAANPLTDAGPSIDLPLVGNVKPLGALSNMAADIGTDPLTLLAGGPISGGAEALSGLLPEAAQGLGKAALENAGWGAFQGVEDPSATPQSVAESAASGAVIGSVGHLALSGASRLVAPLIQGLRDRFGGQAADALVRNLTPDEADQLVNNPSLQPADPVRLGGAYDPQGRMVPPQTDARTGMLPRADPSDVWPLGPNDPAPPEGSGMDLFQKSGGVLSEAITGPVSDKLNADLTSGPITDQERAAAQSIINDFAGAKGANTYYPSAQNADSLAMLMRQLGSLADSGASEKNWYEDSSKAIMNLAQGDKVEAEKLAQLVAIYSPQTGVSDNMNRALTAYYQRQAGLPIDAPGMGSANQRAHKLLYENTSWGGAKTNNFYRNLMFHIDPDVWSELGKVDMGSGVRQTGATIDIWMQRALNGLRKAPNTQAQYDLASRLVSDVGAQRGWRPDQAQAAIWSAAKAGWENSASKAGKDVETAGYNYGTAIGDRLARGYGNGVDHIVNAGLRDPATGADQLAREFGILGADGQVAAPTARMSGLSAALGRVMTKEEEKAAVGTVQPEARAALNAYTAARGLLARSPEQGWARPFKETVQRDQNAALLNAGQRFTPEQLAELQGHLDDLTAPGVTRAIPSDQGAWVLHHGTGPNPAFQTAVGKAVGRLQSAGEVRRAPARFDGETFAHDWSADPSGQTYRDTIRQSGSRFADRFAAIEDLLRGRVEDARAAEGARPGSEAGASADEGSPLDLGVRSVSNEEARGLVGGAWDPAGRVTARPPEEEGGLELPRGLEIPERPKLEVPERLHQILGPGGQLLSTVGGGEVPKFHPGAGLPIESILRTAEGAKDIAPPSADTLRRMPNLMHMANGSPELQASLQRGAEINPDLYDKYQRGVITHKDLVEKLAPQLGMTAEQFEKNPVTKAYNDAELLALRAVALDKTGDLTDAAEEVAKKGGIKNLSPEDKVDFVMRMNRAQELVARAVGGASTAGRTLNQQRINMTRELARSITSGNEAKAAKLAAEAATSRASKADRIAGAVDDLKSERAAAVQEAQRVVSEKRASGQPKAVVDQAQKNLQGQLKQISDLYDELGRYKAMSLSEKDEVFQREATQRAQRMADRAEMLKNKEPNAVEDLLGSLKDELAAEKKHFAKSRDTWQDMAFWDSKRGEILKQRGIEGQGEWLKAQANQARKEADLANDRQKKAFMQDSRSKELQAQAATRILERMGQRGGMKTTDKVLQSMVDVMQKGDPVEVAKFMKSLQKTDWWDRVQILRYAGMLSAATTHTAQAAANSINLGLDVAKHPVAVGADVARSALTGQARTRYMAELGPMLRGGLEGIHGGVQDAHEILRSGINPANVSENIENVGRGFNTADSWVGRRIGDRASSAVDMAAEGPLRVLEASDAAFRGAARGAHTRGLAMRQAIGEGYRGAAANSRMDEIMANLEDHPELVDQAEQLAKRAVFQERRPDVGAFASAGRDPLSILKSIVFPFVRTPYNVAAQGVGLTPAGFLGAARSNAKAGGETRIAAEARSQLATLLDGGAGGELANADLSTLAGRARARGMNDQFSELISRAQMAEHAAGQHGGEAADRAARALLGTLIMGGATKLALDGNLTASAPEDATERSTLPTGWQPWAVKVGNGYYKYNNLGGVGVPLGIAASMVDQAKRGSFDPANPGKAVAGLAKGPLSYLTDTTMLSQLKSVSDAISGTGNALEGLAESTASSYLPYSAAGRQIQRIAGVPTRDPNNVVDALEATYPGLSGMVQEKLDPLGRTTRPTQTGIGAALSPVTYGVSPDDPTLADLHAASTGIAAAPTSVSGIPITPQEQRQLQRRAGIYIQQLVPELQADPEYQKLSPLEQQAAMRRVVESARQSAGADVIGTLSDAELTKRDAQGRQAQGQRLFPAQ